jgi:hypothetical protein
MSPGVTSEDTEREGLIAALRDRYARMEALLQARMAGVGREHCGVCVSVCCREVYCRESLESGLLSGLVEEREAGGGYDAGSGWLRRDGCGLRRGRPPVCYAYFCAGIEAVDPELVAYVRMKEVLF